MGSSLILKAITRRLGLVVVVAGAAIGTSLIKGHLLVAAVAAAVAVLAVGGAIADQRGRSPRAKAQGRTGFGRPYSSVMAWRVGRAPSADDTLKVLSNDSVALAVQRQSPGKIVFRRGNQLWLRLFGGYFIRPMRLPVEVELRTVRHKSGCTIELEVRDRFGFAFRDDALSERFELAVADIWRAVETHLETLSGFRVESDVVSPD